MYSIKQVSLLVAAVCLFQAVAQAQEAKIKHYVTNDAHLIETQRGYALTALALVAQNLKTVSVNGDEVETITSNCFRKVMDKQKFFSNPDRRISFDVAMKYLKSVDPNKRNIYRSGVTTYSFTNDGPSVTLVYNVQASSRSSQSGSRVAKFNAQDTSIGLEAADLAQNLNRIFITGDVLTFVYRDGRVSMKPSNCLTDDEDQFVQQIKRDSLRN